MLSNYQKTKEMNINNSFIFHALSHDICFYIFFLVEKFIAPKRQYVENLWVNQCLLLFSKWQFYAKNFRNSLPSERGVHDKHNQPIPAHEALNGSMFISCESFIADKYLKFYVIFLVGSRQELRNIKKESLWMFSVFFGIQLSFVLKLKRRRTEINV